MSKPAGSSRTSAPMMRDSRMLPTLSFTGSCQSTQLSCTSTAFRPSLRRDRRHLPGVVGLHPADGDERVGALGQRVRHEVLELAGLVAAEGEAGVDVLALGPDPGAAEVVGQPVERVHRARAERQRVAGEVGDGHGQVSVGVTGRGSARSRGRRRRPPSTSPCSHS